MRHQLAGPFDRHHGDLNAPSSRDTSNRPASRCWLPRTDRAPSNRLSAYLNSVPAELYHTKTCLARDEWWRYSMPPVPVALMASSFKKDAPKCVDNLIQARAVGSVCGIYDTDEQ